MEDFLSDDGKVTIEVVCIQCRKPRAFEVTKEGYDAWVNGAHIQNDMPSVPEDDREILISQVCGPCFDKMFREDEV
jgi:hypothetical protein